MGTFNTITYIFIAPTCTTTIITLKPYALNVQPCALNLVHSTSKHNPSKGILLHLSFNIFHIFPWINFHHSIFTQVKTNDQVFSYCRSFKVIP
jgi:hypothetical protein